MSNFRAGVIAASVKAAREAARRSVCHSTIIQHSGFHGPSCDVCRPTMVEAVRGMGNWADHRDLRKDKIARFAAYDQFDPGVLFALEVAAQDDDQSIREAARQCARYVPLEALELIPEYCK